VDDPYSEFLFSNNWWIKPTFVTDGKIYMGHLEHSPIDPRPRGGPFVCLNATDGSVIWRANGLFRQTRWGGRAIIGDSIMATMDTYDQRVYAVGKGQSETMVTAPEITQPLGTPILITGTVMDVSPGTKDTDMQLRFPSGVPAISDEDMSEWMLYVYKQFKMPENVTGVEVVFNWVDSEGVHDLDRTKTDTSGRFSYLWYPPAEGKYIILATFMGSEGYYPSCAQTPIAVGPAAAGVNLEPLEGSVREVEGSVGSLEDSVESLESSVSNLTTYILVVLLLVVIALVIAVYLLLKSRK
jgi:hypothetical protein